ncbi:hypothetical protein Tco_0283031 [Tanacetum coccineum]
MNTPYPTTEQKGLEYTDVDIADFEKMLERIYGREIHRVQDVGFQGMPELMRDGLFGMMRMEHHDDVGVVVFTMLDLDAPGTIQFQLGGARRRLSWRSLDVGSSHPILKAPIFEEICVQLDDTWAWVAMRPERQPDVAASAPRVAQMPLKEGDVHEICAALTEQCEVIDAMAHDFS